MQQHSSSLIFLMIILRRIYGGYSIGSEGASRLNRGGHRFGFVRFLDVKNKWRTEYELDQIRIGASKLYANLPRFERREGKPEAGAMVRDVRRDYRETKVSQEQQKRKRQAVQTYAQAVRNEKKQEEQKNEKTGRNTNGRMTRNHWRETRSQEVWKEKQENVGKGLEIRCRETNNEWLKEAVVGWVREPQRVMEIQEAMAVEGIRNIRMQYLGSDMMLLSGEEGTKAGEFVEENKEWLGNFFESFEEWKANMQPGNRLTWLRCMGMPLNAWNVEGFRKILLRYGSLISVADETQTMENLQYARVLIRTASVKPINEFFKAKVNGVEYDIRIMEEICGGCRHMQELKNVVDDDDLSIFSRNSGEGVDSFTSEEVEDLMKQVEFQGCPTEFSKVIESARKEVAVWEVAETEDVRNKDAELLCRSKEAMQEKVVGTENRGMCSQVSLPGEEKDASKERRFVEVGGLQGSEEGQVNRQERENKGNQQPGIYVNELHAADPLSVDGMERVGPKAHGSDGTNEIERYGPLPIEAQLNSVNASTCSLMPSGTIEAIGSTTVGLDGSKSRNVTEKEEVGPCEGVACKIQSSNEVDKGAHDEKEKSQNCEELGFGLCLPTNGENGEKSAAPKELFMRENLNKVCLTKSKAVAISDESLKPRYNWRKGITISGIGSKPKGVKAREGSEAEKRKRLRKKQQGSNQLRGSESISCSPVNTENRFLCLRSKRKEAMQLWSIGMDLGLKSDVREEEVISKLEKLEERDQQDRHKEMVKESNGGL